MLAALFTGQAILPGGREAQGSSHSKGQPARCSSLKDQHMYNPSARLTEYGSAIPRDSQMQVRPGQTSSAVRQ